jgi:L-fuculose-phosphate aldolase
MNQPDKAHFLERVSREMDEDLGVLNLSPQEALAACCRILAHEGHESGLAGQVTALGEKPGTWWSLKFGRGFEEAKAENMVLVDEDLKPVPGTGAGGRANPGVRFHIWIYRNRPDVKAIITPMRLRLALAATGKPSRPSIWIARCCTAPRTADGPACRSPTTKGASFPARSARRKRSC